MVDTQVLGTCAQKAWRFKSSHPHYIEHIKNMDKSFFKNIIIGVLFAIIIFLVLNWFKTPKITDLFVSEPTLTFNDTDNTISVDGAWLPPIIDSENTPPGGVLLTNTTIFCDKAQNTCEESRAIIYRMTDTLGLQAWTFKYSIQEWGEEFVIATVNLPIRTDELRINRRQKSATLLQTEKGTSSASPQPFIWELVGTNKAIERFKKLNK